MNNKENSVKNNIIPDKSGLKYQAILKSVSKPGRYSGGEFGQIIKNKADE